MKTYYTQAKVKRSDGLNLEKLIQVLLADVPTEAKPVKVLIYRKLGSHADVEIVSVRTSRGVLDVEYHYETTLIPAGSVILSYSFEQKRSEPAASGNDLDTI